MKTIIKFIPLVLALAAMPALAATEKIVGGPKGGRLLESQPLRAEFFVNRDRKVEITFYDAALKPVAPTAQVVSVIVEAKDGRKPLDFQRNASGFVSGASLPAGEPYRVVVQIREKPDARPQNFRVQYDQEVCGGCNRAEYACTCGH